MSSDLFEFSLKLRLNGYVFCALV